MFDVMCVFLSSKCSHTCTLAQMESVRRVFFGGLIFLGLVRGVLISIFITVSYPHMHFEYLYTRR